jgi:hypothetical protein
MPPGPSFLVVRIPVDERTAQFEKTRTPRRDRRPTVRSAGVAGDLGAEQSRRQHRL